MLSAMIGSAIAAAICGSAGVMANGIGVGGLPGILSIQPQFWGHLRDCNAGGDCTASSIDPVLLQACTNERRARACKRLSANKKERSQFGDRFCYFFDFYFLVSEFSNDNNHK